MKATFHGHACFVLERNGKRVIIDPFLTGNPAADIGPDKLPRLDAILLSHGHGDHLGDAIPLAKRDRATIVATFELAQFCGDTALTLEMQLLAGRIDLMLVPIGDNFTMGVEDAARAVEFVKPKSVIPMHYNTWDLIAADPQEFRRLVGNRAAVTILSPGESHTLT